MLHQALIRIQDALFLGIDVERRDLLRRLDAGIAGAGVRNLNQAHFEQHLALPVHQPTDGGVEGGERLGRRANRYGSRGRLHHRLPHIEEILGHRPQVGEIGGA